MVIKKINNQFTTGYLLLINKTLIDVGTDVQTKRRVVISSESISTYNELYLTENNREYYFPRRKAIK